jgi:7,8-dihydropterin-6-yl-methyl-4-(beta-D-ribofuranosyl)aminobenzene 5'-phosphate synthase
MSPLNARAVSPAWWPLLGLASPALVPLLAARDRHFQRDRKVARERNAARLEAAEPLDLPELDFLEISVLVEDKTREGFLGDPGVSYLLRTDRGTLLFDVGMGPSTTTLEHNARGLGVSADDIDAVAISHLHYDHMGGMPAMRENRVGVPQGLGSFAGTPCYLPAPADAGEMLGVEVDGPRVLEAGVASTGPLARSLFVLGLTEEQVLIARVKDVGLVVLTGCGHPTVELIVEMVRRLTDEPIHLIGGGLHFPITASRDSRAGIRPQMLVGTGRRPWEGITDADLSTTIAALSETEIARVLLSAHDSCDHALERMSTELDAETSVLRAGDVLCVQASSETAARPRPAVAAA